jgi:hypothetical protein
MNVHNKLSLIMFVMLLATPIFANADILIGNTATQQNCTQTGTDTAPIPPTFNPVWNNGGLNRNLDRLVYNRDIVAYKIKWSTGWSSWFVTGVNDLYSLTTPSITPLGRVNARLTWIYFYDHFHQYISCS